ncbi:HEAT repeat domain-containing protein [Noviherbaspirillum sp.]|uniref:HEAT repeat domain-containing protein n=1 Tax=Noviherbaspirillum sp. TaxID=1926288 RepID=UPI002D2F2672|nr:HEAT repeat domain-containing protein [Noviherbaspirillum sp.]HZW23749.1 HEAT repeat domain-containing protein [Noviherbaspirillum sp.]
MVFSTLSDPYLFAAFWTGMGALALTLLLGAQIVYLRMSLRRHERLEKAVIATWRPLLMAAVADAPPADLPALPSRERIPFLRLWLHLHQSVRGEASAGLNTVGLRLECDAIARGLLRDGNRAERLLAVLVSGHLRDASAWPELMRLARSADSAVAMQAFWALVQVDAEQAMKEMMPVVLRREDWAMSQVAGILQDAREVCASYLSDALMQLEPEHLLRALHVAEALRVAVPAGLLAALLHHEDAEMAAAALRLTHDPALLPDARVHLAHPDWRVRVQAAKAVGRIGDRSDIERLRAMLGDREWWVRYRAAQALAGLPFLPPGEAEALVSTVDDRFAADMLRHVLAEREAR